MEIIDNNKNTLLSVLKDSITNSGTISIAAESFSLFAFERLREQFENAETVQFLFSEIQIGTFFDEMFSISPDERSKLSKIIGDLIAFIQKDNVLIRKSAMIPAAFIITDEFLFMSMKKNLDAKTFGFSKNGFDMLFSQKMSIEEGAAYKKVFSEIWNDKKTVDSKTDLINILQSFVNVKPSNAYNFLLSKIFPDATDVEEIDSDNESALRNSVIWKKLFDFQEDAAEEIRRRLNKYGVCILADSVGLGKTFTALSIIKDYELQKKNVLVLCPKKLEKNWTQYRPSDTTTNILSADRFSYRVFAHTDLMRRSGEADGTDLSTVKWDSYGLVVIDESHNFRSGRSRAKDENGNYRENRYSFLVDKIIKGESRPKLLLLSATPVNNNFTDLQNQLRLAYEGFEDSFNKKLALGTDIDVLFKAANSSFNKFSRSKNVEKTTENLIKTLDPNFITLLETVSIARSRQHIRKIYSSANDNPFPKHLKPVMIDEYGMKADSCAVYEKIAGLLTDLYLAIYSPFSYIKPENRIKYTDIFTELNEDGYRNISAEGREMGIVNLMRANILKRLESSTLSFYETVFMVKEKIEKAINKIDEYKRKPVTNQNIEQNSSDSENENDSDEDFVQTIQTSKKYDIAISDMDYDKWREALEHDLYILNYLLEVTNSVRVYDAKLERLKVEMAKKLAEPLNTDASGKANKKIIVFTAFADTARYLYKTLKEWAKNEYGIETGLVTGTKCDCTLKNVGRDFNKILTFFSPSETSKNKAVTYPGETGELDLLIATDCISEGQNLQDCDYLVNYDIHWNPVRIIQRFGRIDRIGSKNKQIQLVNFWPDKNLDFYIKLKNRVESKMAAAVLSGAGVGNVLTEENSTIDYRAEQIVKEINQSSLNEDESQLKNDIQYLMEDTLEMHNALTISDFGISEYKSDLQRFRKKGYSEDLPDGIVTVVPSTKDFHSGVIFSFLTESKNEKETMKKRRFNALFPMQLVYVSDSGTILYNADNSKKILGMLRSLCLSTQAESDANLDSLSFDHKKLKELLNNALDSLQENANQAIIESLFVNGGVLAQKTTVEKYELINCFVVR